MQQLFKIRQTGEEITFGDLIQGSFKVCTDNHFISSTQTLTLTPDLACDLIKANIIEKVQDTQTPNTENDGDIVGDNLKKIIIRYIPDHMHYHGCGCHHTPYFQHNEAEMRSHHCHHDHPHHHHHHCNEKVVDAANLKKITESQIDTDIPYYLIKKEINFKPSMMKCMEDYVKGLTTNKGEEIAFVNSIKTAIKYDPNNALLPAIKAYNRAYERNYKYTTKEAICGLGDVRMNFVFRLNIENLKDITIEKIEIPEHADHLVYMDGTYFRSLHEAMECRNQLLQLINILLDGKQKSTKCHKHNHRQHNI